MLRCLALCCLFALTPATLTSGCAADRHALRKDADEEADLGHRADLYWRSVRWGDTASAASFVGDGDTRLRYQQWLDEQHQTQRLSDVTVLRVELHNLPAVPETAADGKRILRRATVIVRTEGYRLPAQVLEEQTVSQTWVRTPDGWFIEWGDD